VCLWVDGEHSPTAMEKLRAGDLVFPTLPEALSMLGMNEGEAEEAAAVLEEHRVSREGRSVRSDVV
jgi:sugar/nucleoside kinase (ribokinase family)